MNFEESIKELEDIVKKMEDTNTTLDESLALFDIGVKKSKECIDILNDTKGKVQLLVKGMEGLTATEFEVK